MASEYPDPAYLTDAQQYQIDKILASNCDDHTKKRLIDRVAQKGSLRHNPDNSAVLQEQDVGVKAKLQKKRTKQKRIKVTPAYKEKQLFDDYNVGILMPELADLRGEEQEAYQTPDQNRFPSNRKRSKMTADPMRQSLSPRYNQRSPRTQIRTASELPRTRKRPTMPSEDIGLMLPQIGGNNGPASRKRFIPAHVQSSNDRRFNTVDKEKDIQFTPGRIRKQGRTEMGKVASSQASNEGFTNVTIVPNKNNRHKNIEVQS